MKRFIHWSLFPGIILGSLLFQSCARNMNITSPLPPTAAVEKTFAAFATIGAGATFDEVAGIQYSNGCLWVGDESCYLQKWSTVGSAPITTIWDYSGGIPFYLLYGVGIDPVTGNVYAVDWGNDLVAVFDSSGNALTTFGHAQLGVPTGVNPLGVAVNPAGTKVYVVGSLTGCIYVYSIGGTPSNPTYTYQSCFGNTGSGPATLYQPYNLRFDASGNVWVADSENQRIAVFNSAGVYLKSLTAPAVSSFWPIDVCLDPSGNVYAVDFNGNDLVKFNSSGDYVGRYGEGVLNVPKGITTDGKGNFYVTNGSPEQIVVFH